MLVHVLSQRAVTTALWCNFLVFSLKFSVWLVSSSHVMFAEVVHSIADFANQVFCWTLNNEFLGVNLPWILNYFIAYWLQRNWYLFHCRHYWLMVLVVQGVHLMPFIRELHIINHICYLPSLSSCATSHAFIICASTCFILF